MNNVTPTAPPTGKNAVLQFSFSLDKQTLTFPTAPECSRGRETDREEERERERGGWFTGGVRGGGGGRRLSLSTRFMLFIPQKSEKKKQKNIAHETDATESRVEYTRTEMQETAASVSLAL